MGIAAQGIRSRDQIWKTTGEEARRSQGTTMEEGEKLGGGGGGGRERQVVRRVGAKAHDGGGAPGVVPRMIPGV